MTFIGIIFTQWHTARRRGRNRGKRRRGSINIKEQISEYLLSSLFLFKKMPISLALFASNQAESKQISGSSEITSKIQALSHVYFKDCNCFKILNRYISKTLALRRKKYRRICMDDGISFWSGLILYQVYNFAAALFQKMVLVTRNSSNK